MARHGGDSFLLNLYCGALDAGEILDGILRGIEYSNFRLEGPGGTEFVRTTVTVGVASLVSKEELDESLVAAEQALALAKQMGRNRLQVSERKKFGR